MAAKSEIPASAGHVSLLGAGPGDPELITVKGQRLLAHADVVFYDALANEALLTHCPPHCEQVYVGKRGGKASCTQAGITAQMIAAARAGKQVVRLKGGDALLFSRGAEEWTALQEAGISVDIIPGVTAALGASATLAQPLTDRRSAHAVMCITGHLSPQLEEPGSDLPALPWATYAQTGATLVLYMAMKRLGAICEALIAGGRPDDTPVTVAQWVTTPAQRVLQATLATVADDVKRTEMGAPAVVIVAADERV